MISLPGGSQLPSQLLGMAGGLLSKVQTTVAAAAATAQPAASPHSGLPQMRPGNVARNILEGATKMGQPIGQAFAGKLDTALNSIRAGGNPNPSQAEL